MPHVMRTIYYETSFIVLSFIYCLILRWCWPSAWHRFLCNQEMRQTLYMSSLWTCTVIYNIDVIYKCIWNVQYGCRLGTQCVILTNPYSQPGPLTKELNNRKIQVIPYHICTHLFLHSSQLILKMLMPL